MSSPDPCEPTCVFVFFSFKVYFHVSTGFQKPTVAAGISTLQAVVMVHWAHERWHDGWLSVELLLLLSQLPPQSCLSTPAVCYDDERVCVCVCFCMCMCAHTPYVSKPCSIFILKLNRWTGGDAGGLSQAFWCYIDSGWDLCACVRHKRLISQPCCILAHSHWG